MIHGRWICAQQLEQTVGLNVFLVEKHASEKYVEIIKTNVLCHVILQKIVPLLGSYKKDGKSRDRE